MEVTVGNQETFTGDIGLLHVLIDGFRTRIPHDGIGDDDGFPPGKQLTEQFGYTAELSSAYLTHFRVGSHTQGFFNSVHFLCYFSNTTFL